MSKLIEYKFRKIAKKAFIALGLILVCGIFIHYNSHLYNGVLANLFEGISTGNIAHANDYTPVRKTIADAFKLFAELAFMFIYIVLALIGKLLSNEWILGDQTLLDVIQVLWIVVRNFVNIIFAIVLVAIAFLSATGISSSDQLSSLAIQKTVPKVIAGIILVNFSLFAAKIVVDFSAITTNAVISIPSGVLDVDKFFPEINAEQDRQGKVISPWRTEFRLNAGEIAYLSKLDNGLSQDELNYYAVGESGPRALGSTISSSELDKAYEQTDDDGNNKNLFVRYKCKIPKAWVIHFNRVDFLTDQEESKDRVGEMNYFGTIDPTTGQILSYDELYGINGETPGISADTESGTYDRICVNSVDQLILSSNNIAFLLAGQTMNIPNLVHSAAALNLDTLTINIMFSFIFLITAFLSFLAILVALLVRSILLWIMLIVSPIWVALWALPDGFKSGQAGKFNESLGFNQFLGLAFMPTLMSIPIVIAYILGIITLNIENSANILQGAQLGGVTIFFSGLDVTGFSSIYQIFVGVLSIAALWGGVVMAIKSNSIVASATSTITDFGDSLMKIARQAPLLTPIPIPSKDGKPNFMSLGGVFGAGSRGLNNKLNRLQSGASFKEVFGDDNLTDSTGTATNITKQINNVSAGGTIKDNRYNSVIETIRNNYKAIPEDDKYKEMGVALSNKLRTVSEYNASTDFRNAVDLLRTPQSVNQGNLNTLLNEINKIRNNKEETK